jgi:hypothetical protein
MGSLLFTKYRYGLLRIEYGRWVVVGTACNKNDRSDEYVPTKFSSSTL